MNLDPDTFTLGGLFVAGLATTLHCAGMCGLLTCGLGIAGRGPAMATVGIYHFARLLGYGTAGLIAGGIGSLLGLRIDFSGIPWLPLLLVLFLIAIVFGLEKKLGTIPGIGKFSLRVRQRSMRLPVTQRAAIVGFATPLLPCGPLYAIIALALASGSAVRGAEVMLAFGLGAIPGIAVVQLSSAWMNQRLGARGFAIAKRSLAGLAALSLAWHFSFFLPALQADPDQPETCRCGQTVE